MLKVPALLKQQVQTVRFQTVRLLYVLQLFFCQFEAPSHLPATQDFSCLSKPVHPRFYKEAENFNLFKYNQKIILRLQQHHDVSVGIS